MGVWVNIANYFYDFFFFFVSLVVRLCNLFGSRVRCQRTFECVCYSGRMLVGTHDVDDNGAKENC